MAIFVAEDSVDVRLRIEGGVWVVEVVFLSDEINYSDYEYAFYLLRNGVRILYRWYEKKKTTSFTCDDRSGLYQARVFLKHKYFDEIQVPILTFDSIKVIHDGVPYDLRRWDQLPIFNRNFASGWGNEFDDGIYHFIDGFNHIDIQLAGCKNLKKGQGVLVCFSGAIKDRKGTSAPFFSGLGLAKKMGVPIISISDPSLDRSHNLKLGWYVGYKGFNDLPYKLAILLDSFAQYFSSRLVLFGGSGGGFASLMILSLLNTLNAAVFVWGPQTSISQYEKFSVNRFLVR